MNADLFNVLAELQRVKGLVAGLYRLLGDGTDTVPTIDFAVDMFDRADADTLGPYWENAGAFVIRTNRAVPAAGDGVAVSVAGGSGHGPGINITQMAKAYLFAGPLFGSTGGYALQYATHDARELALGGAVGAMKSSYKGSFAGTALTCKISFYVPSDNPIYTDHGVTSGEPAVPPVARISPVSTAGISVSDANDGKGLAAIASSITAFANVPGGSGGNGEGVVTIAPASYNFRPADVGAGSLTSAVAVKSNLYDAGGTVSTGSAEGPDLRWYNDYGRLSALATVVHGLNTIQITIAGGNVSATLNGAAIASFTSSATAPPRRLGLAAAAINVLAVLDYLGLDAYGITSFKAWRTDTGEPPNESGHGIKSTGTLSRVYLDKYHAPIFNSSNQLTGYTYRPDA